MDVATLWRRCVSCCGDGDGESNDDDTKLCKITLTLNCCAHHNTSYTVTDGGDAENTTQKEEEQGSDENSEERKCPKTDLLQYTSSCSLRQRSKSHESFRVE